MNEIGIWELIGGAAIVVCFWLIPEIITGCIVVCFWLTVAFIIWSVIRIVIKSRR